MDASHDEPWLDVIPASAIRGRVHVVPAFQVQRQVDRRNPTSSGKRPFESSDSEEEPNGDEEVDNIRRFVGRHDGGEGRDSEAVFSGSRDWKSREFYVNRFRIDPRDTPYHVVDR